MGDGARRKSIISYGALKKNNHKIFFRNDDIAARYFSQATTQIDKLLTS